MDTRGRPRRLVGVVVLLTGLALAGCGGPQAAGPGATSDRPFTLPVGDTEWDVHAPAWLYDGTLHVGDRTVELGPGADSFVLGATGAYWADGGVLMFTSAVGATEEVHDVGWDNLVASADRTVLATVDQSRGPTDDYGEHVMQVAAFDTRTGEQLYRTPDEEPLDGDDLGALYPELMPLLHGVSAERVFFDGTTIDLADGSVERAGVVDGLEVYEGYADTLFADGYHVTLAGSGTRRELAEPSMYATGRLSPDRTTIFDVGRWPTKAVAYDAATGRQRALDAPWRHFSLAGWTDEDTFFGAAQQIDTSQDNVLRARQVVTCELRTLACTPVSPVMRTDGQDGSRVLVMENNDFPL